MKAAAVPVAVAIVVAADADPVVRVLLLAAATLEPAGRLALRGEVSP